MVVHASIVHSIVEETMITEQIVQIDHVYREAWILLPVVSIMALYLEHKSFFGHNNAFA